MVKETYIVCDGCGEEIETGTAYYVFGKEHFHAKSEKETCKPKFYCGYCKSTSKEVNRHNYSSGNVVVKCRSCGMLLYTIGKERKKE